MSARDVEKARAWIVSHKQEWLELQRLCLAIEDDRDPTGRHRFERITRDGIYMMAQLKGITITQDAVFRRDHNLWSVLSRYMTLTHPSLQRVLRTKDCPVGRWVDLNGLPELPDGYVYGRKEERHG